MNNFINSNVEERKYWSDMMKKHLNKELVLTKNIYMKILRTLLNV